MKEDETPEGERQAAPPVLRAELQIPQAAIDAYKAGQEQEHRREKSRFVVEIITLLVVLVYAAITTLIYCANRDAADAAKKAADATMASVQAQSCPILRVQGIQAGEGTILVRPLFDDLTIDQVGPLYMEVHREIKFTVVNFGRGIASQIYVEAYWQTFQEDSENISIGFDPVEAFGHRNHMMGARVSKKILDVHEQTEGLGYVPQTLANLVFGPVENEWEMLVKSGGLEIFGWVEHCDVLDIRRYDPFCFMLSPLSQPPMASPIVPCQGFPRVMIRQGPWRGRGAPPPCVGAWPEG